PLGADSEAVIKRLDEEPDVTIRRALLLSLGEYSEKNLPPDARQALAPKLQDIYRSASDPGLHAAAEWLLGRWKLEAWLKRVNEEWAKDKKERDKRLQSIQQLVARDKGHAPPQWYVIGQGQTMAVIPGPVERIGRTFAIATKHVTAEDYLRFRKV